MDLVAVGWLALQLTGSPFMVAVAAFARSAPPMVLGSFAGIVADRVARGHLLLVTQAGGAATAVVLAVVFGVGAGGYGPLVAAEVLFGLLWSLDFPARRTALFGMLGASRVAPAVSLETVSMQIAKIGGPLVAGVQLAGLGASACYAVTVAVYLVGLAVSSGLRRVIDTGGPGTDLETARPTDAPGRRQDGPRDPSLAATLAEGLRAAWASPVVRAVLLVTVAMNVLFFPYQHMLPVFSQDVLAAGPTTLGALVAPFFLAAFAASRSVALCLALLVAIGLAESAFAAMQSTLVLLAAPAHARGGTMGILSACIGTQPLGTLAIGALAGAMGVSWTFAATAAVALAAIVPLAVPLLRGVSGSRRIS